MNWDDVQGVKAEIFEKVFEFRALPTAASAGRTLPLFAPMPGTGLHRAIVEGRKKKSRDPRDLIALGALGGGSPERKSNNVQLGIFIQKDGLRDHPIVEEAVAAAHGQARIIYTGRVRRYANSQPAHPNACRPLTIGASVGHHRVTAGTLGCICRHDGGGIVFLSNNHVLADTNKASHGDIVLQPGRADGGHRTKQESHVATLFDYVPIQFEPQSRNLVDCAFATMLKGIAYDGTVARDPRDHSNCWPVRAVPAEVLVNDTVRKIGRTTGYTQGRVTAIDVDNLVVAMVLGHGERLARFDGQIAIESTTHPFSLGGDSGSLIWTDDGSAAALLFAGTEKGGVNGYGITYANPIQPVLDALQLDIHTDP
ncbi:hypothetical protein [Methylobacterium sp. ID0610]|uniref:hypothetical protein n=1 Tax=Methylobacterium carpenticola TaxID=3344827 RepID=UPI0036A60F3A